MEILFGAIVSLLAEGFKKKYESSEYATLFIVLIISLAGAGLYHALVIAGYWDALYQILLTAGAFYVFVIKRFKK